VAQEVSKSEMFLLMDPGSEKFLPKFNRITKNITNSKKYFFQFSESYSGNGRNKWPNPSLLKPNWREVVRKR